MMRLTLLALCATLAFAQTPPKDVKKPAPAKAEPAKPAKAAEPAKPADAKKAEAPKAGAFVGNKDSKTVHQGDCKAAAKIKDGNKATFATREEAEKQGYKACKVCLK